MPKLLLFAPCERVILGQDNSVSLIVIIQQMQFQAPPGQPIPEGAGVIARFSVFSQWHKLPADGDKIFEQRVILSIGDGNPVIESIAEFQMTERLHRMIANIPIMPVLHPNEYGFKIFLREKGQQDWGRVLMDYPFEIAHLNQLQLQ
jgi:hypothetical protein